jgi:type I restriction enzyme R subunit
VAETADPQQLYALQHKLNGYQIYFLSEVEGFCKVFFGRKQTRQDHAMLNSFLDPAVQRYMQRDEEEQEEFKGALSSYRNLYAFLSQVIPYNDSDLEKLYAYARFLLSKLPRREGGPKYSFDDEVALEYYRIQKVAEGQIHLTPELKTQFPARQVRGKAYVRMTRFPFHPLSTPSMSASARNSRKPTSYFLIK